MEMNEVISSLAALAQESRLAVFRLLVEAGPEGLPAGRIGESLGLPSATLSFHLSQLRQAGLITCQRQGRSLIYAVEFAAMNRLIGYLTENCCRGDAAACGLSPCAPTIPAPGTGAASAGPGHDRGDGSEAPARARVR